jgi:hypothetical protein
MQLQYQSRLARDWRVSQPLEVDSEEQLSEGQLLVWEATILRHYFDWKVSNLRWECCEFLRRLIQKDCLSRAVDSGPDSKSVYVFQSDHPAHITLATTMQSVAHGFHMY